MSLKRSVFFVDDDPGIRNAIAGALRRNRWECSVFEDGETCLDAMRSEPCDVLVTDLRLPRMDGLEVLKETRNIAPWIPVILLTAYGDVATATEAFKLGAVDFIEKPVTTESLLNAVTEAFEHFVCSDLMLGKPLSKTEQIVLALILNGMSNTEIAKNMSRSKSTIEVHRKHIMKKTGAKNVVDLVVKATAMGYLDNHSNGGKSP